MNISQDFINAVAEKDLMMVHIMLKDSMVVDPTFKEFDTLLVYAENNLEELYDEHDGEVFSNDLSAWTKDYLAEQMVNVVTNFSKERVEFLKNICKHLYSARAEKIELHNRWNLEFDNSVFPEYDRLIRQDVDNLAQAGYWTERFRLTDTWEDVILLAVPIKSSTGELRGVCGMELSDLYFRLSYPAYQSEYGSIVTIVAPVRDGKLMMKEGIHGALDSTYLTDTEVMKIKEGRYFNKYIGESGTYLGVQQEVDMLTAKGETFDKVLCLENSP